MEIQKQITWAEFAAIEMRVGTVIKAEVFKEAKNPSYKMTVDFGDIGTRKTSAQITKNYKPEELIGKQVVAVVNFPPKQIANTMSECLVLGAVGNANDITLIHPGKKVINGQRIG